jgi:hypothetical protein
LKILKINDKSSGDIDFEVYTSDWKTNRIKQNLSGEWKIDIKSGISRNSMKKSYIKKLTRI